MIEPSFGITLEKLNDEQLAEEIERTTTGQFSQIEFDDRIDAINREVERRADERRFNFGSSNLRKGEKPCFGSLRPQSH